MKNTKEIREDVEEDYSNIDESNLLKTESTEVDTGSVEKESESGIECLYSDFSDDAVELCNLLIDRLKEEYGNDDVIGYMVLDGYDVEYPIMQGETNDDYIKSSPYGGYDYNGSIFLDSGNHEDFVDSRNIVYGHNMRNGSMFGNLRNFYEESVEGKTFTIYSKRGILVYDILECGTINAYGDNYYINPGKDIEKEYLERGYTPEESYKFSLTDAGIMNFYSIIEDCAITWNKNVKYNEDSNITTLMTCYGGAGGSCRFTVVGVLRVEEESIS